MKKDADRETSREGSVAAASLNGFLNSVRRRLALRWMLKVLLISGLADILLRLGTHWLGYAVGRPLPFFSIAPLAALVLAARRILALRTAKVALTADAELRLKDRLTSFLNFARRDDLDSRYRTAQADETAVAVSSAKPKRDLPVPPVLWLGPLIFAAAVALNFRPTGGVWFPRGPTLRTAPTDADNKKTDSSAGPEKKAETGGVEGPKATEETGEGKSAQGDAATAQNQAGPAGEGEAGGGGEKTATDAKTASSSPAAGNLFGAVPNAVRQPVEKRKPMAGFMGREPSRLFSETIGESLTPITKEGIKGEKSGSRPGAAAAIDSLRGKMAFDLVPRDRGAAGGSRRRENGAARPDSLEVVVDFDVVPVELRQYVKRYFQALAAPDEKGPQTENRLF